MRENWYTQEGLRRGLGAPALFGIVQGLIAASIYFSLGIVGVRVEGLTWLVYLVAVLFFGLLVLSYVEGISLHTERGGVTVLARYAFNELVSFIAGWAMCLDYLILIAITAVAATGYAEVFWEPLGSGALQVFLAIGIIVYVAVAHIRGPGPRRYERAARVVLIDLFVQTLFVILGIALLFDPEVLVHPLKVGGNPSVSDFLYVSTIVIAAFSGLDASAGLAGQVRIGRRGLPRMVGALLSSALVPYVGIALIATSVLPLSADTESAPVVGVVDSFSQSWIREPLTYLIAASAIAVCIVACNAAMLGLSRTGLSFAVNRQIPAAMGRLHARFFTPFVIIVCGAAVAAILAIPADIEFLVGFYAFGAIFAFTVVHLSVCVLRWREPDRKRPYKMPFNIRFRGVEWPVFAVAGLLMSVTAFVSLFAVHTSIRIVGLGWVLLGVSIYVIFRTTEEKSVLKRVVVPEQALAHTDEHEGEFASILVPVSGSPLDDDIVQTAGRLARVVRADQTHATARIDAVSVVVVPTALALDAPMPEIVDRANQTLARAKAVGEEYEGVSVATELVRARHAGEAIVAEAKRKEVEVIVLAVEKPSQLKGGALLGGKEGLRETFVGETTRYVVSKAPCRVILTAPPSSESRHS